MEKTKIENKKIKLLKIELNDNGDYIAISADDSTMFDRFVTGFKNIAELADQLPHNIAAIEKQYQEKQGFTDAAEKTVLILKENKMFSEKSIQAIDEIFGEGTVKKYFRDIYEEIPDFLPDAECILDFFQKISPIMEELFQQKLDQRRQTSKANMQKYRPQDYSKPEERK